MPTDLSRGPVAPGLAHRDAPAATDSRHFDADTASPADRLPVRPPAFGPGAHPGPLGLCPPPNQPADTPRGADLGVARLGAATEVEVPEMAACYCQDCLRAWEEPWTQALDVALRTRPQRSNGFSADSLPARIQGPPAGGEGESPLRCRHCSGSRVVLLRPPSGGRSGALTIDIERRTRRRSG
jgi:hypothetical protein